MECITEFIELDSTITSETGHSYAEITCDEHAVYLTFKLFAADCLFDLSDQNYVVRFRLSRAYLCRYGEPVEVSEGTQLICCTTQSKLLEIIHCQLSGVHRKLVLESHILFLFYQTQKGTGYLPTGCADCLAISQSVEVDKMYKARKYILDNLGHPLTIPLIASTVGTNQCYLKKGFKEVFDQTIFKFIQENRMVKARHLLQHADLTITEIAFAVGYASLSSFSQAYKNYYGIAPTEVASIL